MKKRLVAVFLAVFACGFLFAQNHVSVNLNNQVYYILEQAEIRGLIAPLSGVRPYTQNVIIAAINEILNSANAHRLRPTERHILQDYLARFSRRQPGLNRRAGTFFGENTVGAREVPLTFNFDMSMDSELSSSFIPAFGETHVGTEIWVHANVFGDVGNNVSYGFFNQFGLARAPRRFLGMAYSYHKDFDDDRNPDFQNRMIRVYSEPLTHFPFTYRKRWDSSVFPLDNIGASGYSWWPDSVSGGYSLHAELTSAFLGNRLIMRLGRMPREWGSMPLGSSLIFNSAARPFLAAEAEFRPFSWFSFSSLSGILEYENREGIRNSALVSQNAFSILMLQLRFRNILFLDLFDGAVWPKRLEFGYLFPITSNFFTQNNIGYFDNMGIGINLKAQYPGLGNVWASVFVDEMSVQGNMHELDRTMIALQAGFTIPLPFLAFSSFSASYTKVNPYCYTHTRNSNPWSGGLRMDTSWQNNGVSLGHYLPPNSDQFLFRFRTMPARNLVIGLQYQLIRRGADFGSSAVDGSNLQSELDPHDRNNMPVLKRFFLQDGAYQWMHITRVNAEWNLTRLPIALFGEAGVNFSYFTNIDHPANVTGKAHPYRRINTSEYPQSASFIIRLGVRVFPR